MSRSLLNMASRLNAVRVDVEDLLLATREVHQLPTEDRDSSWSTPKRADGSVMVAEPVWMGAAGEPLLLRMKTAYFDQSSFLDRVLRSQSLKVPPSPSIERTFQRPLRTLLPAAHVDG